MAYSNGRLPSSALALIPGTTQRVRADLLPQTVAMRAAFATELGRELGVTDGYRSFFGQVVTKAAKPLLAATPGKSNHGWGTALDLGSGVNTFGSREHLWMRANAPAFGWFHPAWARQDGSKPEAWHWEASVGVVPVSSYIAATAAVPAPPPVAPPSPLIPTVQEDDMLSLILWCYRALMGREPSTDDVIAWLSTSTGKTPAQVLDLFLASLAEPGSVVKAYEDDLGRLPSQGEIDSWLGGKPTVRALRAGIAGSQEAKARSL